ncbi:uncharacterized protein LOC144110673 [Amblyomma americanum]
MNPSGSSDDGGLPPDRGLQRRGQDQPRQQDQSQERGSQPQQQDIQEDRQQSQLARTSSLRDRQLPEQLTRQRRRQSRDSSTPSSSDSITGTPSATTLTQTSRCQSLDLSTRRHRRSSSQPDRHSVRVPISYRPMGWSGLLSMRLSPSASPFSLPPELCGPLLQLPLDLCAALRRGGERGNVLLSPHYAACILVMMHHGAAGNTRHQLGHLLRFPEDDGPPT